MNNLTDEERMIIMAMRYAFVRETTAPDIVSTQLKKHWFEYSKTLRDKIREEIQALAPRDDRLWQSVLDMSEDEYRLVDSVVYIVQQALYDEDISADDIFSMKSLGMDSLDYIEIILDFEEHFRIDISDRQSQSLDGLTLREVAKNLNNWKG